MLDFLRVLGSCGLDWLGSVAKSQRNLWLQAGHLKYKDTKPLTLLTTHRVKLGIFTRVGNFGKVGYFHQGG